MEEVAIVVLKKYYEELCKEYKEASKDFFDKKVKWSKIYRHNDNISYYDKRYVEYHEQEASRWARRKIGDKRAKVKALLKELEKGDTCDTH